MNLAIVNARYNSSRFPGKLMQPLYQGRPVLDLFFERIKKVQAMDEFVLATQDEPINRPLWKIAEKHKIPVFTSNLPKLPSGAEDVLGRTKEVAEKLHANTILRVTPDNPCLHYELIHRVLLQYYMNRNGLGYTSNCWYKGFPRGMEVEVFSREVLEVAYEQTGGDRPVRAHWWSRSLFKRAQQEALYDREHVTTFIRRFPRRFGHADLPPVTGFRADAQGNGVQLSEAFPECRLTLDYPADLEVLRNVFTELYPATETVGPNGEKIKRGDGEFSLMDIRQLWETKRELFKANSHIEQKG